MFIVPVTIAISFFFSTAILVGSETMIVAWRFLFRRGCIWMISHSATT